MGESVRIPNEAYPELPILYTYDQVFFGYGYGRGRMLMKSMGVNDASYALEGRVAGVQVQNDLAMKEEEVLDNAKSEDVVVLGYTKADKRLFTGSTESVEKEPAEVNEKNLDKVILRESDVKTALWQPMLTSDDKGNISVEFEAPNFNTTWITQAVAWDKKMIGSTL